MLEVGKLYCCEDYFLLLFPERALAASALADRSDGAEPDLAALAFNEAAYWSNRSGKPVGYTEKNIPLLVLNNEEGCFEVLAGDRKGWIIFKDWLNLKEIE